jgi:hypothetical protein
MKFKLTRSICALGLSHLSCHLPGKEVLARPEKAQPGNAGECARPTAQELHSKTQSRYIAAAPTGYDFANNNNP